MEKSYRVLSIQSHMVSGYCGNKSATFPLQTLGFDVDVLNTLQFSNHTGYPSWTGKRLDANDVQELFDGMEKNGLTDEYTNVLTGYIGNASILKTVENIVKKLKAKQSQLVYVCDPVMGDGGHLYVAPEIVPLYREILHVVDVITPNQTEAEVLTDIKITSLDTAKQAANKLHSMGAPNVIITSMSLPMQDVPPSVRLSDSDQVPLFCMTSQAGCGRSEQHLFSFPSFAGYFTGTGDLFSALTVARWSEELDSDSKSLAKAVYRVLCSVHAVTRRTYQYQQARLLTLTKGEIDHITSKPDSPQMVRACELQLIKGKHEIEQPELVDKNDIKMVLISGSNENMTN